MNKNYAIKQTEENTWVVLDENEEIVDTITKDMIVKICEIELERWYLDFVYIDIFIDNIWYLLNKGDNIIYNQINTDTEDYKKFNAWFNCICVECLAQEITSIYKQRLLDFE